MVFSATSCPNCGQSVSKEASTCPHCGCPASERYVTCRACSSSVDRDVTHCWKCGAEQPPSDQRAPVYGDRWRRGETELAVRVNLAAADKILGHGLLIDPASLALIFQEGRLAARLEAGLHDADTLRGTLPGLDAGGETYAVLLGTEAADLRFQIEGRRTGPQSGVTVRLRLLVQISEHARFAALHLKNQRRVLTAGELCRQFADDVRRALHAAIAEASLDEVVTTPQVREDIERHMARDLEAGFARSGLRLAGVRAIDFSGPAMAQLRERQSEIARAIVYVRHELEISRLKFDEEMAQNRVRFDLAQEQKAAQARTDLEVARAGVEALRLVKQVKLEALAKEESIRTQAEAARLTIREAAGMKALLASVDGAQGDRLLKFAELEMRRGLTAEQALATVAEKHPEMAPALLAALRGPPPPPRLPAAPPPTGR